MKKRIASILLSASVLLSSVPAALAAEKSAMTDISGHWAEEHIGWVMEQELFNGVSDTSFAPDSSMTRGMFVTVLGRFAGIDPSQYTDLALYTDVPSGTYYAPYITWATRYGIANGTAAGVFSPDAPVTREQMATLMVRFASIYAMDISPIADEPVDAFIDFDTVGSYAQSAVETMRQTGLLNGMRQDDGTYRFMPLENATRAQCATIFRRVYSALVPGSTQMTLPDGIFLSSSSLTLAPGETYSLDVTLSPAEATVRTVTYRSSAPNVISVDRDGVITAKSRGSATITAYTAGSASASCTVTCSSGYIASANDSFSVKSRAIFGEVVEDARYVYETAEEAESHMVSVTIQVWDYTDSSKTQKYTKNVDVVVHENIAATVQQIFKEIYELPAQYCFNYVAGYRFSSGSEHTPGLAIDVNPEQNYYCDPDGNALVGTHFDPENDPYSFAIDGEVQQIFAKYGFKRGIYWRSGYKDYMHFSFFGT